MKKQKAPQALRHCGHGWPREPGVLPALLTARPFPSPDSARVPSVTPQPRWRPPRRAAKRFSGTPEQGGRRGSSASATAPGHTRARWRRRSRGERTSGPARSPGAGRRPDGVSLPRSHDQQRQNDRAFAPEKQAEVSGTRRGDPPGSPSPWAPHLLQPWSPPRRHFVVSFCRSRPPRGARGGSEGLALTSGRTGSSRQRDADARLPPGGRPGDPGHALPRPPSSAIAAIAALARRTSALRCSQSA